LEKIHHTFQKGAKGAGILHNIQYSRSGLIESEVMRGLHGGSAARLVAKRGTARTTWRVGVGGGGKTVSRRFFVAFGPASAH